MDFWAKGINPLSGGLALVSGLSSSLTRSLIWLFQDQEVPNDLKGNDLLDIASSLFLGIGGMPESMRKSVSTQLSKKIQSLLSREAAQLEMELQRNLDNIIRTVLITNPDGTVTITIPDAIVEYIKVLEKPE